MKLYTAPDHARLWATLCNYREQSKRRLEATMNALMTIRPHVGKAADPVANDLKATARSLMTDSLEPWTEIVAHKQEVQAEDGWAHSEDSSPEGIQRELQGMVSNDRHERFFAWWETQLREQAETQRKALDAKIAARGGMEFVGESMTVMTDAEMNARISSMKQGKPPVKVDPASFEVHQTPADRLAKYQ